MSVSTTQPMREAEIAMITELNGYSSTIDDLETTVENCETSVSGMQNTVTQNANDIDDLQTSMTTAENDITTLQTNLGIATGNISSLQTSVSGLDSSVSAIQSGKGSLNIGTYNYSFSGNCAIIAFKRGAADSGIFIISHFDAEPTILGTASTISLTKNAGERTFTLTITSNAKTVWFSPNITSA